MKPSMISLIYCSEAAPALSGDAAVLASILDAASANNQKLGVTGAMTLVDSSVLQYLEGDRNAVNELYARILADPRHRRCVILDYRQIGRRLYGDWGMAAVPARFALEQGPLHAGKFDPYALGPDAAFRFIVAASDEDLLAGGQ